MQLIFEHSPFWLLLIIPLAGVIGWWIYYHRNGYEDWSAALKGAAAGLRVALLAGVAFFLLEPFVVSQLNDAEKPKLLVYDDASLSIDSAQLGMASRAIKAKKQLLDEKYDIEYLKFGAQAVDENESQVDPFQTSLESVISSANERFYNQNIGAVVVGTDGVSTAGADPRYLSINSGAPVFALALGDSAIKPDFEITEVLNNKLVFFENDFQIKVRYKATKLLGEEALIKLVRNSKVIAEKPIDVESQSQAEEVTFTTKADQIGLNRYSVTITTLDREVNKTNNSAQTFVDVLDNRTKVLILAKHPHPDVAAIQQAIEASDQYEVETVLLDKWNENIENVDLVVLHALPTSPNDLNKIKVVRDKQIPVWSILTSDVSLIHFESLDAGLSIRSQRKNVDDASGWINTNFNLFNPPSNEELNRFPPLKVIFGDYQVTGESHAVLNQRIGTINADKPLLVFGNKQGWKRAVLAGEGWWRWRLFDRMRGDNNWTDRMVVKTVQYLALKQKRTRLNISAPEKMEEGKEVVFEGEYYNQSFELSNEADLRLELTDSVGTLYEYRFQNNGRGYRLSVGALSAGDYKWKATVQVDGEVITQAGEFLVSENKAEFVNLTADFDFLEQWTAKTKGKAFYPGNEDAMIDQLLALETAKPIIHTSKEWTSLIEWKWLAFLLVLLAAIEWFLRKFNGYY